MRGDKGQWYPLAVVPRETAAWPTSFATVMAVTPLAMQAARRSVVC